MCGIIGYFSEKEPIKSSTFDRMRDSLSYRGPDGADSKFFRENKVALGHRRLSIVDLSVLGQQPMCNEDKTVWLSFNGEIYNHPQLRTELIKLGHRYRSTCDAETVIHAWEEWGADCVARFRGIFAFVIWDSKTGNVFGARDHIGVKPFYYTESAVSLMIASQPRAFVEMNGWSNSVNLNAFSDYLFFGVIPYNKSIFRNVNKLAPGHYLTYENGKLEIYQYWKPQYAPEIRDFEEARREVSHTLQESISLQLMSDVPYGTYLSGGIDSSLITAIAAKKSDHQIPSISVGFKEKNHNELPYARLVADFCDTDHREEILDYSTSMKLVEGIADIHDEPYALGAALPLIFISRQTEAQNLKVVLSGDGADELFAGYHHYDKVALAESDPYSKYQPHEALIHRVDEILMLSQKVRTELTEDPSWRYKQFIGSSGLPVVDTQLLDSRTYLPDEILMKVDRASMAYGVEVRVPFLDQRLVELAFKIDHKIMYKSGERKSLLKAIARDWLPETVLTQRKKGFSIPLRRWMMRPKNWFKMQQAIRNGALVDLGLIDADKFYLKGLTLPPEWLWKYYIAELWARRWITS